MRSLRSLLHALLFSALAVPALAEVPPVHAVRTSKPPLVDGTLDEEVWKSDQAVTGFTQKDPDQGVSPRQRTEVRVAYDDDAIYVGARLYDTAPDSVVARLARRDNDANSDMFSILLDPLHDKRTGYYFAITAAGVLLDGVLMNDEWDDSSWDGVWQARAHRDDKGWTCEMRIPFSQMRFRAVSPMVWGVNFQRWVTRYNEQDAVVYTPRGQQGYVSRFPDLQGLEGLKPVRHLEITPYATNKTEHLSSFDRDDPFHGGWKAKPAGGGDLRTSLGSKLTLNATGNPDFGQVEIDPAVVNLSDVESFFDEKRPFFTEGVSVFRCGNNGANSYNSFNWPEPIFFYSRRIGRSPQGGLPDYPSEIGGVPLPPRAVDFPVATHILGAAKLTGQLAPGWNVGTVQAVTNREEAELDTSGVRSRFGVEPLTYYGVWRTMHELNDRRQGLGLMAMTTARFFDGGADALRDEVNERSVVAALDGWTFLDKKKLYVISGYTAGSLVQGTTARITNLQGSFPHYYQRPDRPGLGVDPNATSLGGWVSRYWLNKQEGRLMLNAAVGAVSPGFDNNDLGFLFGGDVVNAHVFTGWQWNDPKGIRQYANVMAAATAGWDFGGNSTLKALWFGGNFEQRNHWSWNASTFMRAAAFSPRATRGGPLMTSKPGQSWNFYFDTNGAKPWFWSISENPFYSADGSWENSISPSIRWRPKPNLGLSGGPEFYRGHTDAQFIENADLAHRVATGSRFAQLEQTQLSMNLRADYAATPNVSVQVYVQPLISTLRFHALKELARSRTYEFVPVATTSDGTDVKDFSGTFGSLRGNAVVRWEYMPGSAVYFVWTQDRSAADDQSEFDMNRSFKVATRAPANNVFLIKVAHHFDL